MPKKTTVLVLLVVLNLILLSAVLIEATHGKSAFAQQAGAPVNYLAIAGEMQNGYDGVYLIDLEKRQLNLMAPIRGGRTNLELIDARNLTNDFRIKVEP